VDFKDLTDKEKEAVKKDPDFDRIAEVQLATPELEKQISSAAEYKQRQAEWAENFKKQTEALCCDDLRQMVKYEYLFLSDGRIYLDDDENFTVRFCPFCGKKLEIPKEN
jgi:hypothetical protein